MMEEIILNAESRKDDIGRVKVKHLRDSGFIPAVVYRGGKEAHAIKLVSREFIQLMHHQRLENAIINIKIKDDKPEGDGLASNSQSHKPEGDARPCLIKEIQHDPVHGNIVHIDFNEISLTQAIKVNVPVNAKGESVGVKQDGGSLEHVLWEIEIECLPTNIPEEIAVDVTALKIGDSVHVKDLKIPSDVKVLTDAAATVLHVVAPMKEEAPAEAIEGEEKKEPEVIKEKKEVAPEEGEAKEGKKENK